MSMSRPLSLLVATCVGGWLMLSAAGALAQSAAASGSIVGEASEKARETGAEVIKGAQDAASAIAKGAKEVGSAVSRTAREAAAGAASSAQGAWNATKKGAQTVGAAASAAAKAARREVQARHGDGAASAPRSAPPSPPN